MCEEVIQNKLMEHHLPLPEDLTGYPVTDRLGSTIRGTTGMSKGTRWDSEILTGDLDCKWSPRDRADDEEATFVKRNNNLYHEENDVVADAKVDSSEPYDGNDFNHTEKTGFSMQGLSRYKNNNGKSRLSSSSKGLLQMRTSLRHEIKKTQNVSCPMVRS